MRTVKKKPRPKLRTVALGEGLPSVTELHEELQDMIDVLLGRVEPPINVGTLTLMEVSDAYYSRGMELEFLIHTAEREGKVLKGDHYYKFRTGELNDFTELAKRAAELGSRRITDDSLTFEKSRKGRESA